MSNKIILRGHKVPKSKLPFSPAVQSGNFIFISGQASVDINGDIVTGSFEDECRRSFQNLEAVLAAANLDFSDVIQVRNYVGKQEYLNLFNNLFKEFFSEPYPARTTLIGCLGDVLKFEVEAIAHVK